MFLLHAVEQSGAGSRIHGALISTASHTRAKGRELFFHETVNRGFQSGILGWAACLKIGFRAEVFQAFNVALHWRVATMVTFLVGRLFGSSGLRVARLHASVQGRLDRRAHFGSRTLHHLHQQPPSAPFMVKRVGIVVGMRTAVFHFMMAAGLGLGLGAGRGHAFLEVGFVGLNFRVASEKRFGGGLGGFKAGLVGCVWLDASSSEAGFGASVHLFEFGLHGVGRSLVVKALRHRCRRGFGAIGHGNAHQHK